MGPNRIILYVSLLMAIFQHLLVSSQAKPCESEGNDCIFGEDCCEGLACEPTEDNPMLDTMGKCKRISQSQECSSNYECKPPLICQENKSGIGICSPAPATIQRSTHPMSILDAKSAPEGVVVDDPSEHIMSIEDKDNIYLLEEGFVLGLVAESIFISLLVSMLYCFWKSMRSRINKQYDEVSSDGNSRV